MTHSANGQRAAARVRYSSAEISSYSERGIVTPASWHVCREMKRRSPGSRAPCACIEANSVSARSRCTWASAPRNRSGSSARISSPPYGKPPAPSSQASDSALVISPISGPASSSTIAAKAEPLWPPNVSIAPSSTACGSVDGCPSLSIPQPSGMGFPARR